MWASHRLLTPLTLLALAYGAWRWALGTEMSSMAPLDAHLVHEYLACPSPSLAAPSLLPLVEAGVVIRSDSITAARRHHMALRKLPRIQIVNRSIYATCHSSDPGCASIHHELRTLQLLLRVARLGDVDFLFDGGEQPCWNGLLGDRSSKQKAQKTPRPQYVGHSVPVVTHETTSDRCDNILAPPRALKALPDGTHWLARTDERPNEWAQRRNVAVWRGAGTARGRTFAADGAPTSGRAKAVAFSKRRPDLLDARFAGRNDDLQLSSKDRARIRRLGWGADGEGFLTWRELQAYRATLVLDGNTLPDRLPFAMFSMTAVLKQESTQREAWYAKLVPYVHYIPVRRDLSDLEGQLDWALQNASRLEAIARNGAALAARWLSRRAQLCHWLAVLTGLASHTAKPVAPDPSARRFDERGSVLLGGAILHDPIAAEPATLRPQLTHRRPRLSDLGALVDLRLTPCLDLVPKHLCLDV